MYGSSGKEISIGDQINIPCKIVGAVLSGNKYTLTLLLKYNSAGDTVASITGVTNTQVTKNE